MSAGHHLNKAARELHGLSLYFSGEVAIIVMNRGENRLNNEFIKSFCALLDEVEKNPSCKGLITTGTGKFYSNGLDLEWMSSLSSEDLMPFLISVVVFMKRLLMFPLPTLAAINGHAYAGGALIAFAHDLRAMRSSKGWICFNEVFINRRFGDFNLKFLKEKLGSGRNFTDSLVLGRRYTAQEAFDCGMVHATPSEQMLLTESIRVLKSFYGKNGYLRESLVAMKADIYEAALEAFRKDGLDKDEPRPEQQSKL